jgi:hypothetical protein
VSRQIPNQNSDQQTRLSQSCEKPDQQGGQPNQKPGRQQSSDKRLDGENILLLYRNDT